MWADLDPATGGGRLDDEAREALVGAVRGAAVGADVPAWLADAGLRTLLAPVAEPLAELDMVVAGADTRLRHQVWVGEAAAVVALAVRADLHQLLVVPPGHLAAGLARMARLTVRRHHTREDRSWPAARTPQLVTPDAEVRTRALADAGGAFAWHLAVAGTQAPGLTGVDGPGGLFWADPVEDLLRPASNTATYRLFSTAVPLEAIDPGQRSVVHSSRSGSTPSTSRDDTIRPASSSESDVGQ